MFDFITHIIFVASLIVMVYLFARALPRIADDPTAAPSSAFDKLVDRLPLEQVDNVLVHMLENMLRKARILIGKIDAGINRNLDHLRKHSPVLREKQGAALKEKMEHMASVMSDEDKK